MINNCKPIGREPQKQTLGNEIRSLYAAIVDINSAHLAPNICGIASKARYGGPDVIEYVDSDQRWIVAISP